jgi:hypothetical protein
MSRLNDFLHAFDKGILNESLLAMCLGEHEQIQVERLRIRQEVQQAREDDNCPSLTHDDDEVDSGPRTIREDVPLFV